MQGAELLPGKNLLAAGFALLAGVFLPLSLAPFHFWWSGLVSILLLLALLQGASFKQALWRWYLFGIGQYSLGASWVYVSIHTHGGASWWLAGGLTALFVAAVALTVLLQGYVFQRFFARFGWGWILAFPALWFFKEWMTTWLLTGFPWALLGYGQIESPFAGYAPVVGVLGVSFVVALCGTLLFAAVNNLKQFRWQWLGGAFAVCLLGVGLAQISYTKPAAEPLSVSLIQGNVDQQTKWRREMVEPIIRRYTELTEDEWGRDLIVWPEAAITLFADSAEPVLNSLDIRGDATGSALLLGIPRREAETYFNSAVVTGNGSGVYTKKHLVPFGEYVPMENWLRGTIEFFDLPMSHNQPGPDVQPRLKMGHLELALSICYEIAFPDLVRKDAGQAAFLVTISNDTWFGESLGPHQHMQMAQMRALENHRYVVRGTNNGITAVVNERGKILSRLPQFESGVLRDLVIPLQGATPYSRLGNWPLLVGLALLLGYLGYRQTD